MKKVVVLFLSVLALGINFSCDKDDDNEDASIVGSWKFLKEGALVNGQEVFYPYENLCSTKSDYSEIMSNGTMKDYYYNSDCSESIDNATWTKNGNTLTITYAPDDITVLEIIELTSTKLKVKHYDSADETYYLSELERK